MEVHAMLADCDIKIHINTKPHLLLHTMEEKSASGKGPEFVNAHVVFLSPGRPSQRRSEGTESETIAQSPKKSFFGPLAERGHHKAMRKGLLRCEAEIAELGVA